MRWHDPWAFLLFAAVVAMWRLAAARKPALLFARAAPAQTQDAGLRTEFSRRRHLLLYSAAVLCVVALARPQLPGETRRAATDGIDIMLVVDVSGSMLAEDFTVGDRRTNRLDAVKDAVRRFVDGREGDRIGLILFAGRPYTQAPVTLDHGWLLANLDRARVGMIEDGTAVGSALATAVSRLEASTAESKVVILLTDGQNNAGRVDPMAAADAAAALGYRVYTIAAGTRGTAPFPTTDVFGRRVYRPVEVDVDERTLEAIAEATGGKFFRATDSESLDGIYGEIDRLEKSEREDLESVQYRELYVLPALLAFALVLLDMVLGATWLRILP